MLTLSYKTFASAVAALVVTMVMSWAFVDSTNSFAQTHRHGSAGTSLSAAVTALVR